MGKKQNKQTASWMVWLDETPVRGVQAGYVVFFPLVFSFLFEKGGKIKPVDFKSKSPGMKSLKGWEKETASFREHPYFDTSPRHFFLKMGHQLLKHGETAGSFSPVD